MKRRKPAPLQERMARDILNDPQGQYTDAERARVREALERHPERLAEVLREIHDAHRKGGEA
jgi:hypothetical protein